MPKYQVTAPDGKSYEVTAPEGATEQQVLDYAKQNYKPAVQAAPAPPATAPAPSQPKTVQPAAAGAPAPMPGTPSVPKPAGPPAPPQSSQTHWWEHAVERDPKYEYGDILPFRKPKAGGPAEWSPQYSGVVKGAADLFTGPGRAYRGEDIKPEEAMTDAMFLLGGGLRKPVGEAPKPPVPPVPKVEPTIGKLPEVGGTTPKVGAVDVPAKAGEPHISELPADVGPPFSEKPIDVNAPLYEGEIDFGAGPVPPKGAIRKALTATLGEPGDYSRAFDPKTEQTAVARFDRAAAGLGDKIRKLVPDPKAREAITLARVSGDYSTLTPEQKQVAQILENTYGDMGQYALENEAIDGLRQRYSPQMWDTRDPQTLAILNEWKKARAQGKIEPESVLGKLLEQKGMGTVARSPFLMQRVISDVFEGMKLGLKPASLDPAPLLETYMKSVGRQVERSKTVKGLMNLKTDDGNLVVQPPSAQTEGYVKINAPELEGMRVHPDIAPAVRVLMETEDPGKTAQAVSLINYASKRALTMYSGFHVGSLYTAWVGSGGNPFRPGQAVTAALKAYREGAVGDRVDQLLAGGMKVTAPLEDVLGRDRIGNLYQKVEASVDKYVPGKPAGKARALDEWLQKATFEQVMTGLKIDMGLKMYEQALMKNLKGGKLTEAQIAKQVAERVNNVFGSQDWVGKLDYYESTVMRDLMSRAYSPKGRAKAQRWLFAPDWLMSTTESWTDAIAGGGSTLKDQPVMGTEIRRRLALRYIARSEAYVQAIGNALQYQQTGTLMADNEPENGSKDLTKRFLAKHEVHLANGQRLDLSKHFMEPVHMLADPGQTLVGKLGIVPRELMSQIENKEYPVPPSRMTDQYPPNITDPGDSTLKSFAERAGHAGKSFVPIPLQQATHPWQALGGMLGAQARGTPEDEKKGRVERYIEKKRLERERRESR